MLSIELFFDDAPKMRVRTRDVSAVRSEEHPRRRGSDVAAFHGAHGVNGKRALDLVIATASLLLVSPLLLIVALAIRIDSRGPILFRQRRTGLGGRTFTIFKFRTMSVEACESSVVCPTTRGDARVTRVGRILRALSLDELPQLFNVIRGDMSIVGPRPHAIAHDQLFAALLDGYQTRFRVKPGITGLAQVTGLRGEIRCLEDLAARFSADLAYIRNASVRLDCKIMFATVFLIFRDEKAY